MRLGSLRKIGQVLSAGSAPDEATLASQVRELARRGVLPEGHSTQGEQALATLRLLDGHEVTFSYSGNGVKTIPVTRERVAPLLAILDPGKAEGVSGDLLEAAKKMRELQEAGVDFSFKMTPHTTFLGKFCCERLEVCDFPKRDHASVAVDWPIATYFLTQGGPRIYAGIGSLEQPLTAANLGKMHAVLTAVTAGPSGQSTCDAGVEPVPFKAPLTVDAVHR